jgi:NAD(P)H-quinone oxidoreductase subunit 6
MFSPSAAAFYALAAMVLMGATGVALARNLLHAALCLLSTLVGTAGLYLFMGADFLGVAQLLVYGGGILVLLLFAVLFTARTDEARLSSRGRGRERFLRGLTLLAAGAASLALAVLITRAPFPLTEPVAAPTTARLGDAFLREYLLPFQLSSLVLLTALIGAMRLSRPAPQAP